MLPTVPSFYAKIKEKSHLNSTNTYEKDLVCKDYCIVYHDDKMWFLIANENQVILLGEIEKLLHKLDNFCFTYQQVNLHYTLFKNRFSGTIFAKSGNAFHNAQRKISFNQRNRRVDKMLSIVRKGLLSKKIKDFFECSPKEQIKADHWFRVCRKNWKSWKTNFEMELIKRVDRFLDGLGIYDIHYVSFKKNLYNKLYFLLQLIEVMSVPKEHKILVKKEIRKQEFSNLDRF